MTTKVFIESEFEQIREKIEGYYGIQRDDDKNWYVNSPLPSLEELLDEFEAAIDSPTEFLEENLSEEDEQKLIDELENNISEIYMNTLKIRKSMEAIE